MEDTDDSRLRESHSGAFEMSNGNSAFQSQHSFARASSADHDHEALVKAAMQEAARHPERHRMTALPSKTKSSVKVIDVKKMTTSQKRLVLSRAMETSGQDNERLLNQIRQRQDRVGLERSRVEIQFTNINYEAEVLIGSSGLPSVSNSFKNIALTLGKLVGKRPGEKRKMKILKGVTGALKPGRMCLLLGPPGSGKSSLLKILAGKIKNSKLVQVNGDILYNGKNFSEFVVERSSGYVEQTDQHYAALTVQETFDFAAWCQGTGYREDELHELLRREEEQGITVTDSDPAVDAYLKANAASTPDHIATQTIMKLLGLEVCADTIVGDQLLRGISGGQKKRVTSGEIIVGGKKVMFMDEISTGLDSATTFLITKCLSNFCHIMEGTLLVALLQPAPETYNLFDDVMLLSQGQLVYHGPREEVMPFFNKLGFACPKAKGDADFLQDVTIQKGQAQFRKDKSGKHDYMTVKEMAAAFYQSEKGRSALEAAEAPYKGTQRQTDSLVTTQYGLNWQQALKACMKRELKLVYRDRFNLYSRTFQITYLAFLSATLFIKPGHDTVQEGQLFLLEIFFAALISTFAGFGKIPETVLALPVFYKQRDNKFFPAWCYALPKTILDLPLSIWEALLWVCIPYFAVGYYKDAGRFWTYWLVLLLTNMASNALFRGCAAVGRDPIIASTVGVLSIFALVFSGGIMLARKLIRGWWIWAYWISPLAFTVRSLALNEFTTKQWSVPYEYDPSITIGEASLAVFDIQTGYWWVWLGVGVLAAYAIVFNLIATVAFTFLSFPQQIPAMSEEAAAAIDADMEQRKVTDSGRMETNGYHHMEGTANGDKTVDASKVAQKEAEGDAAVANPGSAYGASALGPSAGGGAGAASGSADAGTAAESAPSQPLQNGDAAADGASEDGSEHQGLSLPFDPVALVFKDIHYFVKRPDNKSEELELLKGITGAFRPGVLTALMGASGAGKTTLMDVLADRKTGGRIVGQQKLNGRNKTKATLARVMGYVEQNDIHTPALTVLESLKFSANLRLDRNVNKRSEAAFVDNVLDLVDMQGLRNALVGMPGVSGLSVEQRKRLTIAVELVSNPSIVFMDEPTSGLDARAAAIVMRSVKNTVRTGRTVICTIHQPSLEIFQAFDELLLLQRGGSTLYAGALGENSRDLITYFEKLGSPPITPGYNPATWMLENTTASVEEKEDISFAEQFLNSELKGQTDQLVDEHSQENAYKPIEFKEKYAKRSSTQYLALLKKFSIAYWRTPEYNYIRFITTVILGFVLGTLYWKIGHKRSSEQDVTAVVGAVNATTIFLGALYALNVLPVISVERAVYYRERASFFYHSLPFSLAQCTVELPYIFVQACVYSCIVYWCTGLELNVEKFFWFLLFLLLTLDEFTHVGIMSVNVSSNLQIATTVLLTLIPTWNVLSGFYIAKPQIRGWWIWAYYLNPMTWTTYGLVASQLGDVPNLVAQPDGSLISIADYVRTALGFEHYYIGWCVLISFGWCFFFRVVSAISLQYLNFQTR
ncbi:TPA: hypothetical protein ACH3X1_014944 [Trebouxia sp. C0004]